MEMLTASFFLSIVGILTLVFSNVIRVESGNWLAIFGWITYWAGILLNASIIFHPFNSTSPAARLQASDIAAASTILLLIQTGGAYILYICRKQSCKNQQELRKVLREINS